MKYSELHRKLKKAGRYPTKGVIAGHLEWYSPLTGKYFHTSHHEKQEVAPNTLRKIYKDAGL